MSIHVGIASITGISELTLDQKDAAALESALKDVLKYHPMAVDPAKFAVFQLMFVAGGIYGGKLIQWRKRITAAAAAQPQPRPVPVTTAPAQNLKVDTAAKLPSQLWPEDARIPQA